MSPKQDDILGGCIAIVIVAVVAFLFVITPYW